MTPDTSSERHPLADRIESAVDALPDEQQLTAARELLLAPEEDLLPVVERWEQQAHAA